jgi:hypothetical protein
MYSPTPVDKIITIINKTINICFNEYNTDDGIPFSSSNFLIISSSFSEVLVNKTIKNTIKKKKETPNKTQPKICIANYLINEPINGLKPILFQKAQNNNLKELKSDTYNQIVLLIVSSKNNKKTT